MFFRPAFPEILQSPINCGAFAMPGGLIIVPVVSLFTKKPDSDKIKEVFACYDETVTVPITEALHVVSQSEQK